MNFRNFLFIITLFFIGYDQSLYPQYFIPLQLGNAWLWKDESGIIKKFVLVDTNIVINSHVYCRITQSTDSTLSIFERYRNEDNMFVRYLANSPQNSYEIPFYKYYAAKGDTWSFLNGANNKVAVKVDTVVPFSIFIPGLPIKVKFISVDNAGLGITFLNWTDEYGLLKIIAAESGEEVFNLIACVIKGVIYGDTTTNIIKDINPINKFELYQNYPNPFNPYTNINFEINEYSLVTLKVYDILGKVVADLINEEKHPGKYSIKFNKNKLSSGIYFYKLTAGGQTKIKKMSLMK